MNKKGFTLVELMVVIVIIGILAAVAAPRLSDNINSARCNEVPKNFKKIMDKAVEFEATNGFWPQDLTGTVAFAPDAVPPTGGIDMQLSSQYWDYSVVTSAAEYFVIQAQNSKKIGALAIGDGIVQASSGGAKAYDAANGPDLNDKYMGAYLKGSIAFPLDGTN